MHAKKLQEEKKKVNNVENYNGNQIKIVHEDDTNKQIMLDLCCSRKCKTALTFLKSSCYN